MSADFPEMRASDADRDRVLDMLREAAGDGRLTAAEFDERMEAALSSRTLGELAALTADLGPGPAWDAAATQGEDVVRIDLRPSWCDVTLDFTEAVIETDMLLIDMSMRGGSLILVTRRGIVVDANDLAVRYTDVEIRSDTKPGVPVILRVQLIGRMRYGYIGTR